MIRHTVVNQELNHWLSSWERCGVNEQAANSCFIPTFCLWFYSCFTLNVTFLCLSPGLYGTLQVSVMMVRNVWWVGKERSNEGWVVLKAGQWGWGPDFCRKQNWLVLLSNEDELNCRHCSSTLNKNVSYVFDSLHKHIGRRQVCPSLVLHRVCLCFVASRGRTRLRTARAVVTWNNCVFLGRVLYFYALRRN